MDSTYPTNVIRQLRSAVLGRLAAVLGALWALTTYVLVDLGAELPVALGVAAMYIAGALAVAVPLLESSGAGHFPAGHVRRGAIVGLLVWYGVGTTVLLMFWPGFDLAISVLLAAASIFPVSRSFRRTMDDAMQDRVTHGASLESQQDADEMVDAARRVIDRPGLGESQRVAATVNLAHGLVTRSTLSGREDGLDEAVRLMAPIVTSGQGEPLAVFRAADELFTAMAVQAYKHGDLRGWQEALTLVSRAASRLPDELGAAAQVRLVEAFYEGFVAEAAADPAAATRHRAAAVAGLEELIRSGHEVTRAHARVALAGLLGRPGASDDDLDRAIAMARAAAEGHRARRSVLHPGVVLAGLLLGRAARGGPSVTADTEEAANLCGRALDDDHHAGTAAWTLAQTLSLRDSLGLAALTVRRGRWRRDPVDVPAAFRLAFAEVGRWSDRDASQVAVAWAEWAIERDEPREAAEALWRLVPAVRTESTRRLTRPGREGVVASFQGATAEAGHWLARAGRLKDAVVAMECGRAILLGAPVRHVDPGVEAALVAAGRHDLWRHWLDAATDLDVLQRAQYARQDTQVGQAAPAAHDLASKELAAWSAYDRAAHAIERALGRRPDDLPSYEDVQRSAAGTEVVYLGSARRGGYALIVGITGQPVHVDLPQLAAADVERRTTRYIEARSNAPETWPRVLEETLGWLAGAVVGPLLPHLPLGAELTLVPSGRLGLLPLHAAPSPEDSGRAHARPAFLVRYAPNARVDAVAREIAARTTSTTPTVVAVSASHPPGHRALTWAEAEVSGVEHLYGSACTALRKASRRDTTRALRSATVWHLACHGVSRPDEPLESAIVLEDASLTLREMLTWSPGEHRLAVLSACETTVPDLTLLDEVVSLPGALLRAGVAGVVASQWRVEDRAAALLMLRFHTLLRQGTGPSRALAGAQEWLRTVTEDRLHRSHPGLVAPPPSLSARAEADWRRQTPFRHPRYWAAFCLTGT